MLLWKKTASLQWPVTNRAFPCAEIHSNILMSNVWLYFDTFDLYFLVNPSESSKCKWDHFTHYIKLIKSKNLALVTKFESESDTNRNAENSNYSGSYTAIMNLQKADRRTDCKLCDFDSVESSMGTALKWNPDWMSAAKLLLLWIVSLYQTLIKICDSTLV